MKLTMKLSKLFSALFLFTAATLFVIGCAGGNAQYAGDFSNKTIIETKTNADGTVATTITTDGSRQTKSNASVTAPKDAKEPSTFHLGDQGVEASSGAGYQEIINYTQKNGYIFYLLSGICLICGLLLWKLPKFSGSGYTGLGFSLMGLGVVFALLPTFIDTVGVPLSIGAVAVTIVVGLAWFFADRIGSTAMAKSFTKRVDIKAAQAVAEGKTDVAVGIRETFNPGYEDALRKAQEKVEPHSSPDPTVVIVPASEPPESK